VTDVIQRLRLRFKRFTLKRWQRNLLFGLFGLACFLFFLILTFPLDAARARLQAEAQRAGLMLQMDGLSSGLFGLTASRVRVSRISDTDAVPLVVDQLTARPTFFPPGLSVHAALLGGTASGSFPSSGQSLRLKLTGIDLGRADLKSLVGVDAEGKLDGEVALEMPLVRGEPDLSQASGVVRLNGKDLLVRGGSITVPMFGNPTPVDLPRVALGTLDGEVTFEKGAGKVQRFRLKGDDLESLSSGTMKMGRRPEYVELGLGLRVRPEADLLKRLGVLGAGFNLLPQDGELPGFRDVRVSGYLGKPVFNPGR
jgi:type II secretion system protein N